MSLLYECINGIIQGGVLQGAQGTTEGDDIARLCIGKLRGMLVIEGDPNREFIVSVFFPITNIPSSKICCVTRIQQDSGASPILGLGTRGRDNGMSRRCRCFNPITGIGSSRRNG